MESIGSIQVQFADSGESEHPLSAQMYPCVHVQWCACAVVWCVERCACAVVVWGWGCEVSGVKGQGSSYCVQGANEVLVLVL